jgi:glycosyltransferase involved in cell wall biosynthesis
MLDKVFMSVIIPTHNRLNLLRQTLACLWRQTYPHACYEIIVVDNGSQDGTAEYLSELARQGKIHYIRQQPLGPAVARNVGAQAAQGSILVFTDDDCQPEANWLSALANSYTATDTPPVAVGGLIINVNDGHWLHLFYEIQDERQVDREASPSYLDTANASFASSTFSEIGGFQELVTFPAIEDVDLSYRFKAAGYQLKMNPQAVVWHVGRTTLSGMLRQSINRGQGLALITAKYPDLIFGPQYKSAGWRLSIRRGLDALVERAGHTPRPIRPWLAGLAAVMRTAAYLIPLVAFLSKTRYPQQIARCRALVSKRRHLLLYLMLICADNLLRLWGQLLGSYQFAYRQAKNS